MLWRAYDPERDRAQALRIWYEAGWVEKERPERADLIVGAGRALVAELDGEVECLVTTAPGTVRHGAGELPFCGVTGVTTSRVGRRQGLGAALTARAVAEDAAAGALVAGLGMFDQGFYDRAGFGTGGYEIWRTFDPLSLRMVHKARRPQRVGPEDWEDVHRCRTDRRRGHGSLVLEPASLSHGDMVQSEHDFGLGYREDGRLTHHLWLMPDKGSRGRGPYVVKWFAFRTLDQALELLALIRDLGDQIHAVRLREPPGLQLQDLIERPLRARQSREGARVEMRAEAVAYWQMRICDLPGCLARTSLPGRRLRFRLSLSDPIGELLGPDAPWRGVAGDYVVSLADRCSAEPGAGAGLPTVSTDAGTFTRLWLGAAPASTLAALGLLAAPSGLLEDLDAALVLPPPRPDWDF